MQITLSGLPGAGKGKLCKTLSERLGVEYKSVGDLRREYATSLGVTIKKLNEMAEKDPKWDKMADEYQVEWAKQQESFLLEGRLSYHFMPGSLKLFLYVSPEEGAKRILLDKERKSEERCLTIDAQRDENEKRCKSDNKRYSVNYGIEDCYSIDNFDVIIDTTNKTQEEVLTLAEAKIVDYEQKMHPPSFYLAHPTESKKRIREWEIGFEKRTGINLHNPFHDGGTLEAQLGSQGKEKYLKLSPEKILELFKGDLEAIADKEVIGGIFLIDEQYTLGTPAELMATKLMGKLAYTVITHPEKAYHSHPTLKLLSDKTFPSLEELEEYLKQNKGKLFKELEKSRQETTRDAVFQQMYEVINKNHQFLT